jgi:Arylsulfotransferase (ASST)
MKKINLLPVAGFLFFLIVMLSWGCKKSLNSNVNPTGSTSGLQPDTSLYTISDTGGVDTGQILLAMNNSTNGYLLILNQHGDVLTEKKTGLKVENFQKWTINGVTYYTYFTTETSNSKNWELGGLVTTEEGYDIICDSNLNELSRVTLMPYGDVDTTNYDKLDLHDFILLGPNHYMTIVNRVISPTNIPDSLHPASNVRVIDCLIQEVNNGQVVFQWDGADYPQFYSESLQNNNFSDSVNVLDYMHMNSICIDPTDNNIICSFRNLCKIIKINRTTGAVMWQLGGTGSDFPLTSDEQFLFQHYVRLTDNNKTLIMVDNGDATLRPYSRIVEFQLNQANKTITHFSYYDIPDNFIQYEGSVEKENGYYFIGGGLSSTTPTSYTLQVNYTTGQVYLRLAQKYNSYRSLKY